MAEEMRNTESEGEKLKEKKKKDGTVKERPIHQGEEETEGGQGQGRVWDSQEVHQG